MLFPVYTSLFCCAGWLAGWLADWLAVWVSTLARKQPSRVEAQFYYVHVTWASRHCLNHLNSLQPRHILAFKLIIYTRSTRKEFSREILYKNMAIIAIQYGKFILFTPLAIFPILLGVIHSSPSGKFPYTYHISSNPSCEG